MLGSNFYHSTSRKYVIMFGNLFNDIYINRMNKAGTSLQQFKVPITYSPKQKWYALIDRHPADTPVVSSQLPRIGFEIGDWSRDDSRKNNAIHKLITISDDKGKVFAQFMPVPYKVTFELYILSVNTDDAMQIVEQIIPYFNPDFTSTLNLIPGLAYEYDIRVNMNQSISKRDIYDGDFKERRVLEYSMSFEVDAWYFGPIQKSGIIKRVQVDLHNIPGSGIVTTEEILKNGRNARIVVTPGLTADGLPTEDPNLTIPFRQIDADDDYGYITTINEYADGLFYDPVSGTDKIKNV